MAAAAMATATTITLLPLQLHKLRKTNTLNANATTISSRQAVELSFQKSNKATPPTHDKDARG